MIGVLASVGVIIVILVVVGLSVAGMYNQAATLKNTYEAKISANEAEFDNLKKKICQVAQVSDDRPPASGSRRRLARTASPRCG